MVDHSTRGVIIPEIAERYGRSPATIQKHWTRHPEWPEPIGRRGRWLEYDADAVDKVVHRLFIRTTGTDGSPDDLLTVAEIAEYTGLKPTTIRSDISRGRWPEPDEVAHGVKLWRRATVDAVMAHRRIYPRR